MEFLITTLVALTLLVSVVSSCPSLCSCTENSNGMFVDCINRGLVSVPTDLPNNADRVHMDSNNITSIQAGTFINMPRLTRLLLDSNQIKSIQPGAFLNLPRFTELYLQNNEITSIQAGTFINLPKFDRLLLDANQIKSIQPGAFNNLPSFTELYLDHNKITSIKAGTFINLPKFDGLYLNDNQLTSIQEGTFKNLPGLTKLFLSKNQITSVQEGAFDNLPKLSTIKFTMFCGCTFNMPFWRWLKASTRFSRSISCYDFTGLYLEDLETNEFYQCNVSTPATPASMSTATRTGTTSISTTSAAIITGKKLATGTVIGIAIWSWFTSWMYIVGLRHL